MQLQRYWYGTDTPPGWLRACAKLYRAVVVLRASAYRWGLFQVQTVSAPVVIVGNLTVGGTGKTPLVVHIVEILREAGFTPGVVSRGFGGRSSIWPLPVQADSDPTVVGDEPLLIARRTGAALWVGPDRVAAARALLARGGCDVIVADDGLQHYRLGREVEIAVLDGGRGLGNRRCLPAGPLREPPSRLRRVNLVVCNGAEEGGAHGMALVPELVHCLDGSKRRAALTDFSGQTVHAVAGIGNPPRFFDMLREAGIEVIEHAFADHFEFDAQSVRFVDGLPVLMTEKDGVKCERLNLSERQRYWYVPVRARLGERFTRELLRLLSDASQR